MKVYKSKYGLLPGTTYNEIMAAARREYHTIQKRNPRRIPHIRSSYFTKNKIFLNTFWEHLKQKHPADQERRLKLYAAAIDLLRNSRETPDTVFSKDDLNTMLHRFYGVTKDGHYFNVQVKENKRTNRKDFLSVSRARNPNKKGLPLMWPRNHAAEGLINILAKTVAFVNTVKVLDLIS